MAENVVVSDPRVMRSNAGSMNHGINTTNGGDFRGAETQITEAKKQEFTDGSTELREDVTKDAGMPNQGEEVSSQQQLKEKTNGQQLLMEIMVMKGDGPFEANSNVPTEAQQKGKEVVHDGEVLVKPRENQELPTGRKW